MSYLGNYSKLIAALAGNIVGLVIVYLAAKGIGTCTNQSDVSTCSVMGFSYSQICGAVVLGINALAVHYAPANTPAPQTPAAETPKP